MYRVLMPVDDNSERARAQAQSVANLPHAGDSVEVLLLYVFTDENSLDPNTDEAVRNPTDIESVQRVTEFFDEHGIEYELRKDRNDPVEAILDHEAEHNVDAIVMGGRKRSPGGKVLFGSISHSVLMNTDTPVLLTGGAGGS